jgi:hypothetical protein
MFMPRLIAVVSVVGVAIAATRVYAIEYRPPHVLLPVPAPLGAPEQRSLDSTLEKENPRDREQVIDFALSFTGRNLFFGMGHSSGFEFPDGSPRAASSVDYTYLFVLVFDAAARRANLPARAYRVRTLDARLFGLEITVGGLGDHDWALIVDPSDGARFYEDPTFSDVYLGANIERNVVDGERIAVPPVP